jgi:hypothetical protein
VAAKVRDIRATTDVGFVAGTDYALASPLGFALHDRDVTSLAPRHDAYDDWFDAPAHAGQTALIVADRWWPLGAAIRGEFASVMPAGTLDIVRFGKRIDSYAFYIGTGFGPDAGTVAPPAGSP